MSTTPETAIAERRMCPRSLYSVPVQILDCVDEEHGVGNAIMTTVCHDLSASGMRIFSTLPLEKKTVFIRFAAPNNSVVIRKSRVVRVKHRNEWMWEYGLEFESPLPEETLSQY